MSHTDVHRPWRVQVADPHNRHLIRQYAVFPAVNGEPLITSWRNLGCGCPLCTGKHWRRAERRRDRREVRRVLRRGDGMD